MANTEFHLPVPHRADHRNRMATITRHLRSGAAPKPVLDRLVCRSFTRRPKPCFLIPETTCRGGRQDGHDVAVAALNPAAPHSTSTASPGAHGDTVALNITLTAVNSG